MGTFALTVHELEFLCQAAGMAGDRLARQENYAGSKVMDTLQAATVQLNDYMSVISMGRESTRSGVLDDRIACQDGRNLFWGTLSWYMGP